MSAPAVAISPATARRGSSSRTTSIEANSLAAAEPLLGRPIALALVDLGLPDGHGATLIRRLTARPQTVMVAFTIMDDDRNIDAALGAGAQGYLLKDAEPAMLAQPIERLLAGELALSPAIGRRVLAQYSRAALEETEPL